MKKKHLLFLRAALSMCVAVSSMAIAFPVEAVTREPAQIASAFVTQADVPNTTEPAFSTTTLETTATTTYAPPETDTVSETTASTLNGDESAPFSCTVTVKEMFTTNLIEGLDVRLEKRWYDPQIEDDEEGFYTGEIEVLETWNTSDANPHTTAVYQWTPDQPFSVFFVIDVLPDGYSHLGREIAETSCPRELWETTSHEVTIDLTKEAYWGADFPITGTYSQIIRLVDFTTNAPIEGLDCVLLNLNTGEEVFAWNTTEQPVVTISDLQYCFLDWHMSDTFRYAVKILNLPEIYDDTGLQYLFVLRVELESGNDTFEETIRLWRLDSYLMSTLTTTAGTQTTTTTTTTTTAETEAATGTDTQATTTTATEPFTTGTTETAGGMTTTTVRSTTADVLPQTGNNRLTNLLLATAALGLMGLGAWAVFASDKVRRRRSVRTE